MNNPKALLIMYIVAAAMGIIASILYFIGSNIPMGIVWLAVAVLNIAVGLYYYKKTKQFMK